MNINNKIEIHRGVYFPRPEASALSLNWKPGHTTQANELAFLALSGTNVVMEPIGQMSTITTAADQIAFAEGVAAGNLFITHQGSEEPYNKPDLTDGLAASTGLNQLMVPENLYVRFRDAYITFDATKLLAETFTPASITSADVGKNLYLFRDDSATTLTITVGRPGTAVAGDDVIPLGLITKVDTTTAPGATLVTVVC